MGKRKARPTLFLDAGNTVVFLDHEVVARIADGDAAALRAAEGEAKRAYARALRDGSSHESGWRVFMSALLEAGGVEDAGLEKIAALEAEHARMNLWRRVPEDLPAALDAFEAAGWRVGVVSNSEGMLVPLFDAVGLGDRFDVIVDSHHVGVRKPDPAIFEIAMDAMNTDAAHSVYAGDIPEVDLVGAHAAGLRAYLVDPLGYYEDGAYIDADRAPRVPSVHALVDLLLEK